MQFPFTFIHSLKNTLYVDSSWSCGRQRIVTTSFVKSKHICVCTFRLICTTNTDHCLRTILFYLSLLSLLSYLMGAVLSPAMVPGSDLDTWQPPPWPAEHTDSEGKVQAYKEGGRFQNPPLPLPTLPSPA